MARLYFLMPIGVWSILESKFSDEFYINRYGLTMDRFLRYVRMFMIRFQMPES